MYDLAIIGGGPAGYVAAEKAGAAGQSVVLFEKRELGGVCLNEGCIPTKTLLYSAKMYDHATGGKKYGITAGEVSYEYKKIADRKTKVVRKLVAGIKMKMEAAGVAVVRGEAVIERGDAQGVAIACDGQSYEAKNLLICTGSEAFVPPIPGVENNPAVLTNREMLALTEAPASLVVIGGGVIGLEMAAYYAAVGAKVTVIEMLDHIAGPTDREISTMLQKELEKKGVTFLLGHKCLSMEPGRVFAETPEGEKIAVEADKVLLSIGRRAEFAGLGLEAIGVETYRAGIVTDDRCRTNIPGVWAVGDVNGHHLLAHTAYREAEVAVNDLLGREDKMVYHANPSVIYTQPEIASVGMTEEECKNQGVDYEVQKLSMRYSGRFVAETQGADGLCKILIDKACRKVLGVHLIGNYSGEIIWGGAEMIEKGFTVTDARKIIFPHPTVSEIIREVLWEFPD